LRRWYARWEIPQSGVVIGNGIEYETRGGLEDVIEKVWG